ncbi:Co-chaperone Hsc20 [Ceratobasidium sp. AG-I]|nr:Co-chaperone Hsc20 [Ceratobasidium sp. AG-I]
MSLLRLRSLVRAQGAVVVSRRTYSTLPTNCPKCSKSLPTRLPICPSCSHVDTLPADTSYYTLFNLPENSFKIDTKDLRNRFLQTQRLMHPDAWSSKPEKDQAAAATYSSFVNKAYETLRSPLRRAEYLLSLRGAETAEADSLEDQGFIMEVMEVREEVEELEDKTELENVVEVNQERVDAEIENISKAFDAGDLNAAKHASVRLKYWIGVEESAREKLRGL